MYVIANGVWILYALDRTMPGQPAWIEQANGTELARLLTLMLRWRDEGQQVRLEWIEEPPPPMGPDDFKIGTRHPNPERDELFRSKFKSE